MRGSRSVSSPDDRTSRAGRVLLASAAIVFAVTGLGYLVAPGVMLGVVGIDAIPVAEFLIRTEGVALLTGAILWWILRDGGRRQARIALVALAGYCLASSAVDLLAYLDGIVGPLSVPSIAVRCVVGIVALAVAGVRRGNGDPMHE